jgi:hypothetical protein
MRKITKTFYEYIIRYQLAVFNIGELKNEKQPRGSFERKNEHRYE